jgi:HD-GYP domain-containing protein (c-di-GMP phosphodiesterase class II)
VALANNTDHFGGSAMRFTQLSAVKHRVTLGQPLPFNIRNADQTLLLARGLVLDSREQMEALFERGSLVDLAELRSPLAPLLDAPPEMLPALWEECMDRVGQTLKASAQTGFGAALEDACGPVLSLIERDSDLAIFQVLRQPGNAYTEYGAKHSLHAAIAVFLVAKRLKWSEANRQTAFKAALTMNLSMLEWQGRLATQTTPITPAQRQALVTHPQASVRILEQAGIADRDWLRAVAEHHEVPDGSGYPAGLREVSDIAALVRRADVYTAKLSARKGRAAMTADKAGRDMFMQEPNHPMAAALAKEFGMYPPGCYVKLASGETAVVLRRGASVMTPLVAVLTTPSGVALAEPEPRDTSRSEHAIACVIDRQAARAHLAPEKMMALALA